MEEEGEKEEKYIYFPNSDDCFFPVLKLLAVFSFFSFAKNVFVVVAVLCTLLLLSVHCLLVCPPLFHIIFYNKTWLKCLKGIYGIVSEAELPHTGYACIYQNYDEVCLWSISPGQWQILATKVFNSKMNCSTSTVRGYEPELTAHIVWCFFAFWHTLNSHKFSLS